MIFKRALIGVILLSLSAQYATAQTPQPLSADDCRETQQLLTRALLELEHCRNDAKISKDEMAALKSNAAALQAAIATDEKQLADLKAANAARSNADSLATEEINLYEKRIALYKSSIADYETEVTRLRKERDRARSLLKFVAGAGFALGIAVAYVAFHKN